MDTQTIVIVAVAVNVVVAILAIFVPSFRERRARATATAVTLAASRILTSRSAPAAAVAGSIAADEHEAVPPDPWFADLAESPAANPPDGATGFAMDPATGLDSDAAWARWLAEEEARIQRFHRPATVVLVELAGLDRLSERLGPEAAERLIPPIATTLRGEARATDHLARLGGTRFAALLTETTEVQAIHYVERVRDACDLWLEAGAVALRLSLGWAEIGPDRPADVAFLDAERRLIAEREKMRRQLVHTDDDPPIEMATFQPSTATTRSAGVGS
jgi:diguanylate cyclase (GGDEF)-like protein